MSFASVTGNVLLLGDFLVGLFELLLEVLHLELPLLLLVPPGHLLRVLQRLFLGADRLWRVLQRPLSLIHLPGNIIGRLKKLILIFEYVAGAMVNRL